MPVVAECACGRRFRAEDKAAGRTANCPNCGQSVTFPPLSPPEESNPFDNPMWQHTPEVPEPPAPVTEPPPVPTASELPPKTKRSKKPVLYALAATCLAALVTAIVLYGPWEANPSYEGRTMSSWGSQLRDASEAKQGEAVDALAAIGVASYRYMPDILTIAEKSKDPGLSIESVKALSKIAQSSFTNPLSVTPKVMARAKRQFADLIPRVEKLGVRAKEERDFFMARKANASKTSDSISSDYLEEIRRGHEKWTGIAEQCFDLKIQLRNFSEVQ